MTKKAPYKETAGKRAVYGDLTAAAGSLFTPRYRSRETRESVQAVTVRDMARRPVAGSLSFAAVRPSRRASPLTVVDHRGSAARRSVIGLMVMMCRAIGARARTMSLSARLRARRPRRGSWGRRNADMALALLALRAPCLLPALGCRAGLEPLRHSLRDQRWRRAHSGGCDESRRARREAGSGG